MNRFPTKETSVLFLEPGDFQRHEKVLQGEGYSFTENKGPETRIL